MPSFPPITVRQPQPYDLVDDPVDVCGVGTGFEARIGARVRDASGAQLAQVVVSAGGTGIWGNYHIVLRLGTVPQTPQGTVEVFGAAGKEGVEVGKVVVPIIFGRALIDPYHGFAQHTVVAGDTLSALAQRFYGDAATWPRILEANRDQVLNPDRIFPGQTLRIPQ
jgi:LysM domain/Immunoglobulin-like domain of bacterial spore germination